MRRLPTEPTPNDLGVTIKTFVEDLIDDIDEVRAVTVTTFKEDDEIIALGVHAHTSDQQLQGEGISLYDSNYTWIHLSGDHGQELNLPVFPYAAPDGEPPPSNLADLTVVYCDDSWDIGPVELEEGLNRLRRRVGLSPRDDGAKSVD